MYKVKRFSKLRESSYSSPISKLAYGISKPFVKNKTKLGRGILNKETQTRAFLNETALNPGGVVSKGVREAAKNPVTGGLVAGGNLAAPVVPGITEGALAIGKPIDNLLRKRLSKVYEVSGKLGDKLAPISEGITNSVMNFAKNI